MYIVIRFDLINSNHRIEFLENITMLLSLFINTVVFSWASFWRVSGKKVSYMAPKCSDWKGWGFKRGMIMMEDNKAHPPNYNPYP